MPGRQPHQQQAAANAEGLAVIDDIAESGSILSFQQRHAEVSPIVR